MGTSGGEAHRPRIMIVASTDRLRGAEIFSVRLAQGLTARGWIVDAVGLSASGDAVTTGYPTLTDRDLRSLGRLHLPLLGTLRRRIAEFEPDLVIANGGPTLRYTAGAVAASRRRFVYVGIGEPGFWFRSRLIREVSRWLLRRAAAVWAVSSVTAEQFVRLEPTLGDRTFVAHQGVPEAFFEVPAPTHEGPLRVVVVGSLSPEKDPALALEVIGSVDGVQARFVGDGPLRAELEAESVRLGCSDRVEFVGQVVDVATHIAWADALLLTSRTEGLPGVVLEAAAAGRAVLSVDVGGVRDAVRVGETGHVVRGREALQVALSGFAADVAATRRMGAAGRTFMAEYFTMEAAVERYVKLIEDA